MPIWSQEAILGPNLRPRNVALAHLKSKISWLRRLSFHPLSPLVDMVKKLLRESTRAVRSRLEAMTATVCWLCLGLTNWPEFATQLLTQRIPTSVATMLSRARHLEKPCFWRLLWRWKQVSHCGLIHSASMSQIVLLSQASYQWLWRLHLFSPTTIPAHPQLHY